MVDRYVSLENRVKAVEEKVANMDTGLQTLTDAFDNFKVDLGERLDTITVFVTGANTIYGLAKRHWRRVLIFGAGVMTSAGLGNPNVWHFISSFAGG